MTLNNSTQPEGQLSFWDYAAVDEMAALRQAHSRVVPFGDLPNKYPTSSVEAAPKTAYQDHYIQYLCNRDKGTQLDEPSSHLYNSLQLESVFKDKRARNYQETGIKFALGYDNDQLVSRPRPNREVRVCIADQMRLGKTPQALLTVANLLKSGQARKVLIVVKSANLYQWIEEHKTWLTPLPTGIWPILGGKAFIPAGFTSYIISMDTLRSCEQRLIDEKFDTVIADEAHSFKNLDASRTISFNKIISETPVQNILFLTGTPVKNRADEYYTILHNCAPRLFPSEHSYKINWLEQDDKGKYTRIKSWRLKEFREVIAPFILRREKEDVYDDLPSFNTMYTVVKIEEKRLQDLYNKELDKMNLKIAESGGKINYLAMQDSLMTLRRICGMAKVQYTVDYVKEFIEESEDEKIAIGIHHKDVRDSLRLAINKSFGVITLSGEDSAARKFQIMDDLMKRHENRVLIINSLAGGVGMDFHYINNFLVTERQWNYADEQQFAFRFYNPDSSIKKHSTFGEYLIAKGTADEFWHNMVESKKHIFNETLDSYELQSDSQGFKHLIEETMDNRL